MDLRTLPDGLNPKERCDERRKRMESELDIDVGMTEPRAENLGQADETNCEQMFGSVPMPVGYAGPLSVRFSNGATAALHLPLATTEGALVASVNRGCKALSFGDGVTVVSTPHGISRSIAWKAASVKTAKAALEKKRDGWVKAAEATSSHLKIVSTEIETAEDHLFLTLSADTDEAMGMNMITIAAQAVGEWAEREIDGLTFVTVAANVDSDKKPSLRTYERGRGIEIFASADISTAAIRDVLKTTPETLVSVAHAKLQLGSELAGALGSNLHVANIIAALYLATGQDAAHVVEGSLADTAVEAIDDGIRISVRLPAVIVGVRGGGTGLPAQSQCLKLLLKPPVDLHPKIQLAESIGAAVLAGELSLLAAQAGHDLARAHAKLGRNMKKL